MLRVISKLQELPFRMIMDVYLQSNEKAAQRDYPGRTDGIVQAEMDIYEYLRNVFFQIPGACYCLWEIDNKPVSVLRLEPYRDGFLITALETHPAYRGQGYAQALLGAVIKESQSELYSHIHRTNRPSVAVHKKCGFEKITNYAIYLDGSVSSDADTYRLKFVKN